MNRAHFDSPNGEWEDQEATLTFADRQPLSWDGRFHSDDSAPAVVEPTLTEETDLRHDMMQVLGMVDLYAGVGEELKRRYVGESNDFQKYIEATMTTANKHWNGTQWLVADTRTRSVEGKNSALQLQRGFLRKLRNFSSNPPPGYSGSWQWSTAQNVILGVAAEYENRIDQISGRIRSSKSYGKAVRGIKDQILGNVTYRLSSWCNGPASNPSAPTAIIAMRDWAKTLTTWNEAYIRHKHGDEIWLEFSKSLLV